MPTSPTCLSLLPRLLVFGVQVFFAGAVLLFCVLMIGIVGVQESWYFSMIAFIVGLVIPSPFGKSSKVTSTTPDATGLPPSGMTPQGTSTGGDAPPTTPAHVEVTVAPDPPHPTVPPVKILSMS